MASDEFDLKDLIGEPDDVGSMPTIENVPASQLNVPEINDDVKCAFCDCWMAGLRAGKKVCVFHTSHDASEECLKCKVRKIMHTDKYLQSGHATEKLSHPIPQPIITEIPDAPQSLLSPDLKDEAGSLDEEYYRTFNATIEEVKDLEPEALQELRHRLDRMIRRAKIQQRAIRVTEEGKLEFIEEKRRKAIKTKDQEFMARRKKADDAIMPASAKAPKTPKSSGVPQIEKQIKQFVKLNMNEAVIRATLQGIGATVPDNLAELIAKYR